MLFLDTDVLIECLRGSQAARSWLRGLSQADFQIPGIVAMELLAGCRDKTELTETDRFIRTFSVAWPDSADMAKAYELLYNLRLASGLGIPDCLIAAMAILRGAKLYSFNLKHFHAVPSLDVEQPYQRP